MRIFAGVLAALLATQAGATRGPATRGIQAIQTTSVTQASQGMTSNSTLTAVPGLKVGHHTLRERPTGCTVILAEGGATAGVDVRGAAPATRETDLLAPVDIVQQIHALVLSGGSAFGLDSASGVMKYLEEKGIGFPFGGAHVPTVPGASLFDLAVGDARIRPSADCGYQAARAATAAPVEEGSVGAGAGATVGHFAGFGRAMKSGIGSAALRMPDGLIVAALVAVNAAGDVIDPATGRVVAGTRTPDGRGFADARVLLRNGVKSPPPGENTTLGVVATNAALTKTQATRVSQMAHDGFARAIAPSHTAGDGDAIFTLATGNVDQPRSSSSSSQATPADVSRIGALAAEAIADAIVRAVRQATSVSGFPALRDLK